MFTLEQGINHSMTFCLSECNTKTLHNQVCLFFVKKKKSPIRQIIWTDANFLPSELIPRPVYVSAILFDFFWNLKAFFQHKTVFVF